MLSVTVATNIQYWCEHALTVSLSVLFRSMMLMRPLQIVIVETLLGLNDREAAERAETLQKEK